MTYGLRQRRLVFALIFALALSCAPGARAQETDEFGDTAADPVKLFNRGQEAHAKKEYERALELYEEALQLRPDFPEAEFQRAAALVALKRVPEAEKSYRRAMELRRDWPLPPASLGLLLVRTPGREREAEPSNVEARLGRADLLIASGEKGRALEDVRALEQQAGSDWKLGVAVVDRYGLAGHKEEARRVFESLPAEARASEEGKRLQAALADARCEEAPETRAALERLVASDPKNAAALACLGRLTRTTDPERSADFYRRAAESEPRNVDHAVGYAAALVQLRRFPEAAAILRRVIQIAPDKYEAHANLAAALIEMKLYNEAVVEYKWVSRARPELPVVHFFIAIAHDRLGEYEAALEAYETFLARADARVNQLEIEKVNLRLPSLRNQIKRGEGLKKDKRAQ